MRVFYLEFKLFFRSIPSSTESSTSLTVFAQHVLREICSQQWVLERCFNNTHELFHPDMLQDPLITIQQAQRLLHMICYPERTHFDGDHKVIVQKILEV